MSLVSPAFMEAVAASAEGVAMALLAFVAGFLLGRLDRRQRRVVPSPDTAPPASPQATARRIEDAARSTP